MLTFFLHLHSFLPKFGSSQTSALPHTILPHGMSAPGGISGMFQRELTNSFTLVFPWMLGRFRLQVVKLNIIYPANQTGNSRNQGKLSTILLLYSKSVFVGGNASPCFEKGLSLDPSTAEQTYLYVRKMLKKWLGPCGRDVSSQSSEGLWLIWLRKSFD